MNAQRLLYNGLTAPKKVSALKTYLSFVLLTFNLLSPRKDSAFSALRIFVVFVPFVVILRAVVGETFLA